MTSSAASSSAFFEHLLQFVECEKKACDQQRNSALDVKNPYYDESLIIAKRKPVSTQQIDAMSLKLEFTLNADCDNIAKLSKGMNVIAKSHKAKDLKYSGIVAKIETSSVFVVCDDPSQTLAEHVDSNFQISVLRAYTTFKRMKEAINRQKNLMPKFQASDLSMMIFEHEKIESSSSQFNDIKDIKFNNSRLNELQRKCVTDALRSQNLYMIHGPPGTGKTTVLMEIVQQMISKGKRILFTAPSNTAVDNLLLKMPEKSPFVIRLGKVARINENNLPYHVDTIVQKSSSAKEFRKLEKELTSLRMSQSNKLKGKQNRTKLMDLENDIKHQKHALKHNAMSQMLLFASTLANTNFSELKKLKSISRYPFDAIIIDECSQALIPLSMIPLELSNKIIIAGDHHQLPPTVLSPQYSNSSMAQSFMEFISCKIDPSYSTMLCQQYRMNQRIMQWPSRRFYESKLVADESCSANHLGQLSSVADDVDAPNILVIDCTGDVPNEMSIDHQSSIANEYEANIVCAYIDSLKHKGLTDDQISVISPYKLQVDLIRKKLSAMSDSTNNSSSYIEVNSVDGFQGRENEVVIISFVRSNLKRTVGFLDDYRRLNVALTRAKRHLVLVADIGCLNANSRLCDGFNSYCELGEVVCGDQMTESVAQLYAKYPALEKASIPLDSEVTPGPINMSQKVQQQKSTVSQNATADSVQIIAPVAEPNPVDQNAVPAQKKKKKKKKPKNKSKGPDVDNNIEEEPGSKNISFDTQVGDQMASEENLAISMASISLPVKNKPNKVSKKATGSQPNKDSNVDDVSDDEDMAFLKHAVAHKNDCGVTGCKNGSKFFNNFCEHCVKYYCVSHRLPEAHGCAKGIRAALRKDSRPVIK